MKRAFGMAGRGHRVVTHIDDHERTLLRHALEEGGLQIEPNVAIVRELGIHGVIEQGGRTTLGRIVSQRSDPRGQWLATEIATDVTDERRVP